MAKSTGKASTAKTATTKAATKPADTTKLETKPAAKAAAPKAAPAKAATAKTTAPKAAPAKATAAAPAKASAAPKPKAQSGKPAAKPAQKTEAKPAAAAAKATPAAAKSTTSKPAAAKPEASKPAAAKPATKTEAAPAKAKAAAPKPTAKAAATKTKTAVAKPAAAKPAASKAEAPAPKPAAAAPAKIAEIPAAKAKPAAKSAPARPAAKAAAAKPAPAAKAAPAKAVAARSGAKPWLESYPANVPAEMPPLAHSSIGDLLTEACRQYAGRPAFSCMGKSMSYGELERMSTAFAAWLQSKGLAKGARVAIMMPNVLQYPVAMMAILRAGYTVVNVNPLYTPRELEHQLKDSGAEAIIILENFATTLQAVVARTQVKHVVVASMGEMLGLKGLLVNLVVRRVKKLVPAWSLPGHVKFMAALKEGSGLSFKPVAVKADDIAFLQYTGGTTGVSKGAMLIHSNVLANVAQLALWVEDAYTVRPKPPHLTFVCALPLYHIFALTVNALMGMQQGALNVLIPNPRDIPGFVKELGKFQFNIFPGLNTLFNALTNNEDFRKLDFSGLILSLGGGMAVQRPVAERWKKATGNHITEGYGLSETSPVATANKCSSPDFTGTIGLPLPSTDIAIRDEDDNDMPLGEVGEICIRGPQVMAGYWNRPDETAKVMTSDGFFKSGDMGFMDERGFTKIVDRKKDMILVSGFNVYPNELEDVVAQHPGVLEVAAVGVPDEHSGEVPKLFVVRKDPDLTVETLIAYCRENLTGYKRPKYIEFRTELPKTNVGKILRRELRG
ncbi:long-chain fatty acid--CoA ligase [Aminobacter anthyllidis]|uniref:long-chain fatty acid--CoA ligase n=1 Tax=Aminobacter anthyllidis TaxID=1035067 RepID=UPI002456090F|nr:long-chain fatty acid--CoA ligase [Aminobacter anthyllidis]MDH4986230.1 long-chain fatty acid--CoA ligase [Aminobacter anthyllidis]